MSRVAYLWFKFIGLTLVMLGFGFFLIIYYITDLPKDLLSYSFPIILIIIGLLLAFMGVRIKRWLERRQRTRA